MDAPNANTSFLPVVYDILKSFEKDPQELPMRINDLKVQLEKAKEEVQKLPGIDLNKEEQERQMEILRQQLATKTELLCKYKHVCSFDDALN